MRVSIIPEDTTVCVDGDCLQGIDMSSIASNVHAVQWYDTWGEVEFKDIIDTSTMPPTFTKPQNQFITDFSPYQTVVNLWQAMKDGA